MRRVMMMAGALALGAGTATAGGIERSNQSVGILFEQGNYAELNFGAFSPDVSGTVAGGLVSSGDMGLGYGTLSLGYKRALTDKLDMAIILDQPVGADLNYSPANAPYPLAGSRASIDSTGITALLRYKLPNNFSVHGGVRAVRTSGEVALFNGAYTMDTSTETDFGYVLGVAWEKPEIAARVALTYSSAITHAFDANENVVPVPTAFETEIPQSVNLEFQTGIAADTLLFGSIRWVDWTAFDISPVGYVGGFGSPLVKYDNDVITYTLGLGRKFNETWSGAVILGYEKHEGTTTGNLGPHDGMKSIALAATYTKDNIKVTGGLRYVDIGDATTNPPVSGAFSGNSGWGAGLRVGFSF